MNDMKIPKGLNADQREFLIGRLKRQAYIKNLKLENIKEEVSQSSATVEFSDSLDLDTCQNLIDINEEQSPASQTSENEQFDVKPPNLTKQP